jgi:hypothetical protein
MRSLLFKGLRCVVLRRPMSTVLSKGLRAKIQLTLAEYMREVLTRPHQGYFMNKDVFGMKGDFITRDQPALWRIDRSLEFNFPFDFSSLPQLGTLSCNISSGWVSLD